MPEWINPIVTIVAFLIVFLHQKNRIKNLSDQILNQQKLFDSLKAFIEGVNPELLVFRTKQYEELVAKEAKIQIEKYEGKFKELEKTQEGSIKLLANRISDLLKGLVIAMPFLNTSVQSSIVDEIKDSKIRKVFQEKILPEVRKLQEGARREAAKKLECEGIESKLGAVEKHL